jgi:hypothetical protein
MRIVSGFAAAAVAAGLGLSGLGAATQAHALPGPFPRWCPGDFWDPGWGPNWAGGIATTTGGDLDRTLIPTHAGGRDGGPGDRLRTVSPS